MTACQKYLLSRYPGARERGISEGTLPCLFFGHQVILYDTALLLNLRVRLSW